MLRCRGRRERIAQFVVDIFDEIHQEGRHIQDAADPGILFDERVCVIVSLPAPLNESGQRNKQSGGISALHQIPQVQQPRHSSVPIKVGMQVGQIEVEQRSLQQVIHIAVHIGKFNQSAHVLREFLPTQARVLHLVSHHIDAVVPVEIARQQAVFLWEKDPNGHLVQLVKVLFADLMGRIHDKFQALLHGVNPFF